MSNKELNPPATNLQYPLFDFQLPLPGFFDKPERKPTPINLEYAKQFGFFSDDHSELLLRDVELLFSNIHNELRLGETINISLRDYKQLRDRRREIDIHDKNPLNLACQFSFRVLRDFIYNNTEANEILNWEKNEYIKSCRADYFFTENSIVFIYPDN